MKNKNDKRYYFAFGSNLKHSQMQARCPHAEFIGAAKLNGWKLDFGGYSMRWRGGTATITQDSESETWGAIYELDKHCIKKLDRFETVHLHFYHHRVVDCVTEDGSIIKAYTYVKNKSKMHSRLPSYRYIHQIEVGAVECDIPKPYVRSLARFHRTPKHEKLSTRKLAIKTTS